MKFKNVPLHEIKSYENNVKQHPIKQLEELANNVQKFGFRGSILIDKNNVIIAGHARYEVACALGMTEIMCEMADDLTEEQVAEYRIKDNLIAEMGYTDFVKLQAEMAKAPDADFSAWDFDFNKLKIANDEEKKRSPFDNTEFIITINCQNESEQQSLYEELNERGFECKLLM